MIPTALLLTWAGARFEWITPDANDPFTLTAMFPASAVGEVAHIVPIEGVTVDDGYLRRIEPAEGEQSRGFATWRLRSSANKSPVALTIRYRDVSVTHSINVGGPTYTSAERRHGGDVATRVEYQMYRPFGFVPSIEALGLPAWLLGLVALIAPMYLLGRRWLDRV